MGSRNYDYLFKVVLIGDSGVGKTSLLKRYRHNEFSTDTKHTIGVEFATQEIEVEDKLVKTQIWDTAGQERYRAITKAYYRGALGAILLYDITDRETFENLRRWISEIRQHASEDIKIMLVGNKKDLENDRKVSVDEGKKFAKEHELAFLESSAKNGDLVIACFETVIRQIFKQQLEKDESKKIVTSSKEKQTVHEGMLQAEPVSLEKPNEKAAKASCCSSS